MNFQARITELLREGGRREGKGGGGREELREGERGRAILPEGDGYANSLVSDTVEDAELVAHLHKLIHHLLGDVWAQEPPTKVGRLCKEVRIEY